MRFLEGPIEVTMKKPRVLAHGGNSLGVLRFLFFYQAGKPATLRRLVNLELLLVGWVGTTFQAQAHRP